MKKETNSLREGFTTGACATAAAGAATRALITGAAVSEIVVDLPARKSVSFDIASCEFHEDGGVSCTVIKDAGDDPDVTHGAEIGARVEWSMQPGIHILGGNGVGVVTKPGLPVEVGQPAINPVPLRMIESIVLYEASDHLHQRGLDVEISVAGGAEIAKETLNPRLGILGGISILGTSGIVKPYSTTAYKASIHMELKVAYESGLRRAILTTGTRSEQYAFTRYPRYAETGLGSVQVGDHMGYGLRQARRLGYRDVVISGMIGKLSKLAQGRMQTHVDEGEVDFGFLAGVSRKLGADNALVERIAQANTAHHVQVMLREQAIAGFESEIAKMAAEHAYLHIDGSCPVEVLLWTIKGELLAVESAGDRCQ